MADNGSRFCSTHHTYVQHMSYSMELKTLKPWTLTNIKITQYKATLHEKELWHLISHTRSTCHVFISKNVDWTLVNFKAIFKTASHTQYHTMHNWPYKITYPSDLLSYRLRAGEPGWGGTRTLVSPGLFWSILGSLLRSPWIRAIEDVFPDGSL